MGTRPKPPAIVQLLTSFQKEGVRFILVGMSAANLQGVLAATIDVDIWIDLPSRQYMRVINLSTRLKATFVSANKVYLRDGTPVDFIYEISGLRSFDREFSTATRLPFHGLTIPVLPLERICRSKQAAGRDKDKLHVILIRQTLAAQPIRRRKNPPTAKRASRATPKTISKSRYAP